MLIRDIYHHSAKTFPSTGTIEEALETLIKDRINALVILDDKK